MASFQKPHDVRWVDMAIWCDKHAYEPDCDNDKLYQYLYWLFWMLAHQSNSFHKESDYDEYSLMGATTVYYRLKNPKQFDGSGKLQKVKSVLNYIKTVSYPICVLYQQQSFAQAFSAEDDPDKYSKLKTQLVDSVIRSYDRSRNFEFQDCLNRVKSCIKDAVSDSPYRSDKLTYHNIYISCLLTILNYLSLDKVKLDRLNYRQNKGMNNDYVIDELYSDVRYQPALLFHLPKSMSNYISTLVNRAMSLVASDLVSILGSYQPSDAIIKAVLTSPLEDYVEERDD